MMNRKLYIALLALGLSSCGQPPKKEVDPAAIELNKQALSLLPFIDNPDSSQKAIDLLDKATSIDSNYFSGHLNKLMFYYQLHQYDKALATNAKLIGLRPMAHDLYLRSGLLCTQLGDSTKAKAYFNEALTICNAVLDTMSEDNRDHVLLTTDQAIALKMLGDDPKANAILQALYDEMPDDPTFDNVEKKNILTLMNLSRRELLDRYFSKQVSDRSK